MTQPITRKAFLVGAAVFAATFLLFAASPIVDNSDSRYSMLLSESIQYHRSSHLNSFRLLGPVEPRATSSPPTIDPQNPATYQLAKINGEIVYCFPNGSSVPSITPVAIMNDLGVHSAKPERTYHGVGEIVIEKSVEPTKTPLMPGH